jgi:hypothetical protein
MVKVTPQELREMTEAAMKNATGPDTTALWGNFRHEAERIAKRGGTGMRLVSFQMMIDHTAPELEKFLAELKAAGFHVNDDSVSWRGAAD